MIGLGCDKKWCTKYIMGKGGLSQKFCNKFPHRSKTLNTSLPMNMRGEEEEEAKEA